MQSFSDRNGLSAHCRAEPAAAKLRCVTGSVGGSRQSGRRPRPECSLGGRGRAPAPTNLGLVSKARRRDDPVETTGPRVTSDRAASTATTLPSPWRWRLPAHPRSSRPNASDDRRRCRPAVADRADCEVDGLPSSDTSPLSGRPSPHLRPRRPRRHEATKPRRTMPARPGGPHGCTVHRVHRTTARLAPGARLLSMRRGRAGSGSVASLDGLHRRSGVVLNTAPPARWRMKLRSASGRPGLLAADHSVDRERST